MIVCNSGNSMRSTNVTALIYEQALLRPLILLRNIK